ncbi:hypothetical protein [Actinokineospora sp. UTMC 2448]|uniref:hypothetical protein n=1 Tax=Actinokineospora sp. UTMC 2448 TaxID=2268449 RepID=UPI002164176D|nr:hypothetical protein [Actinokineospora sp. UTMC 2448]UVS80651.1 hypothetical protein Actkin_04403 [Actinokineospora sp. UTMC 2448]
MTSVNEVRHPCVRQLRRLVAGAVLAAGVVLGGVLPAAAEFAQVPGKLTEATMTTADPSDWPWLVEPVPQAA